MESSAFHSLKNDPLSWMSHTQCTGNRRSSPAGRPIGIPAERHIVGYFTPYSENTQYPRLQKSKKTEKFSFSIRPWKYPERRCSLTRTIFPAIPTQFPFRKFTDFCFSTSPFTLLLKRILFSTERSRIKPIQEAPNRKKERNGQKFLIF